MQTVKILEIGEKVYYFADKPTSGKIKSRIIKENGTVEYRVITDYQNKEYQGDRRDENEVYLNKEEFSKYLIKLVNEL